MKKKDAHILQNIKKMVIMLGVFIGLMAMNREQAQDAYSFGKVQQTEQSSDDDAQSDHVILKIMDVIHTSVQVHLSHEVILIDELHVVEATQPTTEREQFLFHALNKVFKILFQSIISPNAP